MVLVPIVLGLLVLSMGFRAGLYYPVIVNFGLLLIFLLKLVSTEKLYPAYRRNNRKTTSGFGQCQVYKFCDQNLVRIFFTECSDIGDSCVAPTTRYMGAL